MAFNASKVQAVLFDLDGTLADTDDEYIRRVARLLRPVHFLFPWRDPTAFLRWGLMAAESPLNMLMGIPDWLGIDEELVTFANWLSDRRGHTVAGRFVIMPGIEPMLAHLSRRYPLAVVTSRSERLTRSFLEQFGIERFFRAAVSAQTAPHTKPYPDPVRWAAKELGVPVESCAMVGDTTVDILAGKRAGAQAVGVLCGFGQREELQHTGANLILNHTADLAEVLQP